MYRCLTAWVSAMLLGIVVPVSGQEKDKLRDDQQLLQGAWKAVGLESDGKPSEANTYADTTLTFDGNKVRMKERGYPPTMLNFQLDPTKSPKAIDYVLLDGPRQGEKMLGIYELKGDELKLCFRFGKGRPTEFKTRSGDDTELMTLKQLPPEKWQRFTAKEDGFSIEFPGEPESRKRRDNILGVSVMVTIYVVRSDREGLSYLALGYKLPAKLSTEKEMTQVLQEARDKLLAEFKATIVRDKKLDVKQGLAWEYLLRSTIGGGARGRIYVLPDRLYFVYAVGVEDLANSKSVERFLQSLQMIGAP